MSTEMTQFTEQGRALWKGLNDRRRLVMGLVVMATLAAIGYFATRQTETFQVLFSGMAADDAGRVLDQLKAQHVPFKLEANGTVILAPATRVHELRLALAQSGLPRGGGIGFELFDKPSFGTTSFVEQMNYRRALQGELQRTIASLDSVEQARVHIAMREHTLFKSDDSPASASVVLRLRAGRQLSAAQVRGVVHMVASSVEGLAPDRVTLLDERGAVLSSSAEDLSTGLDLQRDLERTLSRRISEIVERVVGVGHVAVVVTSELDRAQTERTEEAYDRDKVAVRSETRSTEREAGPAGASAAAAPAPLAGTAPPTAPAPAEKGLVRFAETRNYEVNRVISKTTGPKVTVKRLHVAVLVETLKDAAGKPVPRSADDLSRIEKLVREAAGLDTTRGDRLEVHSAPFAAAPPEAAGPPPEKTKFTLTPNLIIAGVAGLFVLIIGVLMLRRGPRRELDTPRFPIKLATLEAAVRTAEAVALPEKAAAPPPALSSPIRDRALEVANNDAVRAASVLSAWMDNDAPGRAS